MCANIAYYELNVKIGDNENIHIAAHYVYYYMIKRINGNFLAFSGFSFLRMQHQQQYRQ